MSKTDKRRLIEIPEVDMVRDGIDDGEYYVVPYPEYNAHDVALKIERVIEGSSTEVGSDLDVVVTQL